MNMHAAGFEGFSEESPTATAAGARTAPATAGGRLPVSATLIAFNEEARIGAAIAAVRDLVEDVVVVDSGSTDRTVEIAAGLGARVFHRDWTGYGAQKFYAEGLARHDWILSIDADEIVSDKLAREIRSEFAAGPPPPGAYALWVVFVYPGDDTPRPFARDHSIVRLFHRAVARTNTHPIHDRVAVADGIVPKRLSGPVHHLTIASFAQMIDKGNRFSSYQAEVHPAARLARLKLRLFFEMPYWFARAYLIRGHWTGGWKGFVFALNMSFFRAMKIAKIIERLERDRR